MFTCRSQTGSTIRAHSPVAPSIAESDAGQKVVATEDDALEEISLEQVRQNESWMVIYDKVYDLTEFFSEVSCCTRALGTPFLTVDIPIFSQHPGGAEVLMENGGRDASNQFRSVGHSEAALKMLDGYLVGILPQDERLNLNLNP